jgi:hypothetical protein
MHDGLETDDRLKGVDELCGCGKPVRYLSPGGGSCSKGPRCPTYDEQRIIIANLNLRILQMKSILSEC